MLLDTELIIQFIFTPEHVTDINGNTIGADVRPWAGRRIGDLILNDGSDNFVPGYASITTIGITKAKNAVIDTIRSDCCKVTKVIAFGDSYNDVSMLKKAEVGILFCPPQKVIDEFPELPVAHNYEELRALIEQHIYTE